MTERPNDQMSDRLLPEEDPLVSLEVFEGPLDLLLHLVRAHEINILDLPMETLTRQYLNTLRTMGKLELPLAGEYFVMAAELLRVKSLMLLPRSGSATNEVLNLNEENATGPDPRAELVRQLLDYQRLKKNAAMLEEKIERQALSYPCLKAAENAARPLKPFDRFELMGSYTTLVRRLLERVAVGEIMLDPYTVSQAIETILQELSIQPTKMLGDFLKETEGNLGRMAAIFVAVLELTRLGEIDLLQTESFGDVTLTKKSAVPAEALS